MGGGCFPAPANPPPRAELVEAWANTYGRLPPKRTSTRLLTLSYAYHLQAATHGGLTPKATRKLTVWAGACVGRNAQGKGTAKPRVAAGTRLTREWHGETHIVEVLDTGLIYREKTYRSLSEVARAITGARWSGPRFFGISPA
jgi:hypothetical protein